MKYGTSQQHWPLVLASVLLCIVALPDTAYANPVTSFVFSLPRTVFGLFRFLYGNAIIGMLEGLLIAGCFGTDRKSTVLTMILANCFSGAMGFVCEHYIGIMPENPLRLGTDASAGSWLTLIVAFLAYFVAAVVLEWPFCYWLVRFHDCRMRAASFVCVTAQAGSYLALIPVFSLIGGP